MKVRPKGESLPESSCSRHQQPSNSGRSAVHPPRLGRQVRDAGRNGGNRRPKQHRQAHDRNVHVERRRSAAPPQAAIYSLFFIVHLQLVASLPISVGHFYPCLTRYANSHILPAKALDDGARPISPRRRFLVRKLLEKGPLLFGYEHRPSLAGQPPGCIYC
jgi:hypothetical protein